MLFPAYCPVRFVIWKRLPWAEQISVDSLKDILLSSRFSGHMFVLNNVGIGFGGFYTEKLIKDLYRDENLKSCLQKHHSLLGSYLAVVLFLAFTSFYQRLSYLAKRSKECLTFGKGGLWFSYTQEVLTIKYCKNLSFDLEGKNSGFL